LSNNRTCKRTKKQGCPDVKHLLAWLNRPCPRRKKLNYYLSVNVISVNQQTISDAAKVFLRHRFFHLVSASASAFSKDDIYRWHKSQPTLSPYLCSNPFRRRQEFPLAERLAIKPKQAKTQTKSDARKDVSFAK